MSGFSLLSLNTFGIPFYLGWERLSRLTHQLNRSPCDLICLQEIQQNSYADLVKRNMVSYPHAAYTKHWYAPQGGLVILSRIPFQETRFEVFAQLGSWHSLSLADWGLFKGMQTIHLEIAGTDVVVLNTHLNANYSGIWNAKNHLSRILQSQVQQLGRLIGSFPADALVVVCGDLNFPRHSFLYDELMAQNHLIDPLAEDLRSTYRPFPLVPAKWNTALDYALFRPPKGLEVDISADLLGIEDTNKKSRIQRFLTDHNALLLEVNWDAQKSESWHENTGLDQVELLISA